MPNIRISVPPVFEPLWKPATYKALYGGRSSGKSHAVADFLVVESLMHPGLKTVCVREIQRSIRHSSKALIEEKIRSRGLEHLFKIQRDEIQTPGGGVMIFVGMQDHTADSIKSLEGFDRLWGEEANKLSYSR